MSLLPRFSTTKKPAAHERSTGSADLAMLMVRRSNVRFTSVVDRCIRCGNMLCRASRSGFAGDQGRPLRYFVGGRGPAARARPRARRRGAGTGARSLPRLGGAPSRARARAARGTAARRRCAATASLEPFADRSLGVARAANDGAGAVVGHSLGGLVALRLARGGPSACAGSCSPARRDLVDDRVAHGWRWP